MTDLTYDLVIIGGGINGCGIARDAIGRGMSVYLCEQGDLGGATSSSSTKLLHGGLRYLEHYKFNLVREALKEREVLWGIAPHIVQPMRFVLPYSKGMRPAWLLRLGLFIYDNLGGRKLLPGTSRVDLTKSPIGEGLKDNLSLGYEYSDCRVEDNRLVILNAQDAQERGAIIKTRTQCVQTSVDKDDHWHVVTRNLNTNEDTTIRARMLVNAAGPWANKVADELVKCPPRGSIRQVQGSHIVAPKIYDHDRCFIFQNKDGRIVFTIPYEDDFTLIGTTDQDFQGNLQEVTASEAEISYLCEAVSLYFKQPLTPDDVVWSFETLVAKGLPFYRYYYSAIDSGEALSKHRVRFNFKESGNQELPLITGQLPVLPKHYWETRDFSATTLDPPLGSGPYRIQKFEAGRYIVQERVTDYWGAHLPVRRG
ncbi:MAG: glycerol-3-phosphate dehydrogenase, partial [Rhizobiales bacterium]|nr:glycerol-3-phosphate dehydrogenase [Hyphomicrobiales bacterium]